MLSGQSRPETVKKFSGFNLSKKTRGRYFMRTRARGKMQNRGEVQNVSGVQDILSLHRDGNSSTKFSSRYSEEQTACDACSPLPLNTRKIWGQ